MKIGMTYDLRDDYLAAGFGEEETADFDSPYTFSDPLVLSLPLHKALTKRVVRDLGIPTPDFIVVEKAGKLNGVNLPFPLFAKPVAEGAGKGISAASKHRPSKGF